MAPTQTERYYKILLLTLCQWLISSEIARLMEWSSTNYFIDAENGTHALLLLDQNGIINILDLSLLRGFLESLPRPDLVRKIDDFLNGDYSFLRSPRQHRQTRPKSPDTKGRGPSVVADCGTHASTATENSATSASQSTSKNVSGTATSHCNGCDSKTSAARRQVLENGGWLCSHYKRRCFVKFDCCDSFWPCHRCHNNQSSCGHKKLKARHTTMIKCAYCNKVQEFGRSCSGCGIEFADYFCALCKHLTSTDDHPYHCGKCKICRINGDRSYHCDICGVCLDEKLRGNHKCREGSAHDGCVICLEDAFTGCQILPCSHKVHKECASQMIRSGIVRCPVCKESFAHKLERRTRPTHDPIPPNEIKDKQWATNQ